MKTVALLALLIALSLTISGCTPTKCFSLKEGVCPSEAEWGSMNWLERASLQGEISELNKASLENLRLRAESNRLQAKRRRAEREVQVEISRIRDMAKQALDYLRGARGDH